MSSLLIASPKPLDTCDSRVTERGDTSLVPNLTACSRRFYRDLPGLAIYREFGPPDGSPSAAT